MEDARFGEILDDLVSRKKRGEPIRATQLRAEYPENDDELLEALELVGGMRPAHGKVLPKDNIENLVARGILSPSSDPAWAAELGPYQIKRVIGSGGMGVVFEAYEESLDRAVALKTLRPELINDATALDRFTREARAAAALRHPNIVTIHVVGEEQGTYFIAMEYIEGPTLTDLINERGALPASISIK